jgi:hypothetical protein
VALSYKYPLDSKSQNIVLGALRLVATGLIFTGDMEN